MKLIKAFYVDVEAQKISELHVVLRLDNFHYFLKGENYHFLFGRRSGIYALSQQPKFQTEESGIFQTE